MRTFLYTSKPKTKKKQEQEQTKVINLIVRMFVFIVCCENKDGYLKSDDVKPSEIAKLIKMQINYIDLI